MLVHLPLIWTISIIILATHSLMMKILETVVNYKFKILVFIRIIIWKKIIWFQISKFLPDNAWYVDDLSGVDDVVLSFQCQLPFQKTWIMQATCLTFHPVKMDFWIHRHTHNIWNMEYIFKYDYEMLPIQCLWQVVLKSSYKRVGVLRQTSSLLW